MASRSRSPPLSVGPPPSTSTRAANLWLLPRDPAFRAQVHRAGGTWSRLVIAKLSSFLSANVVVPSRVNVLRHAIWQLRARFSEYLEAYVACRFCNTLAEATQHADSDEEFTDAAVQLILANGQNH